MQRGKVSYTACNSSFVLSVPILVPMPVAVLRSNKAWVCGRSFGGTVGSDPARGTVVCVVIVVCWLLCVVIVVCWLLCVVIVVCWLLVVVCCDCVVVVVCCDCVL